MNAILINLAVATLLLLAALTFIAGFIFTIHAMDAINERLAPFVKNRYIRDILTLLVILWAVAIVFGIAGVQFIKG